ncbi:MAG: sigma-54-dependent Fis family transcriptional regulator [Gemmatimonadaceae bacterium]|nr:sigma-54-dependent Fis family transcriptional regulator [Gemmatimonadaceae bacterium]
MTPATLLVHGISDSFGELWPRIAAEVGLGYAHTRTAPRGVDPTRTVVLLAAGGEETALARAARELRADGEVTFAAVAAEAGHRLAASVLRAGADQLFVIPEDLDLLRAWIKDASERLLFHEHRRSFAATETRKYTFEGILGASGSLAAALERVAKVIPHSNVTVLVTGETGTGKELIARAIHYNGPRREMPFVDINCAALPEHLLESDLFGHEKGAFTDASATKPGLFEMAQGGSIFLDEVGHLALPLQGKLLRALQERSIRRVGGVRNIPIDVRVIAATHVNLEAAVRAGEFREDLYYRLNVLPVALPPLRDRHEDIIPLARLFLARFASEYGVPRPELSPRAASALRHRAWPGNIRELRNVIERTILLADKAVLEPEDFEFETMGNDRRLTATQPPIALADIIRDAVREALERCGGNKSEAARRLGISRPRLVRLLEGDHDA